MQKNWKKIVGGVVVGTVGTVSVAMADTTLTMPEVDTSNLVTVGGAVLAITAVLAGIVVAVNLFKKSKSA